MCDSPPLLVLDLHRGCATLPRSGLTDLSSGYEIDGRGSRASDIQSPDKWNVLRRASSVKVRILRMFSLSWFPGAKVTDS